MKWDRNPLYRPRAGSPSRPLLLLWIVAMVGFTAYLLVTGHFLIAAIYAAVSLAFGIYGVRRGWNAR